MTSDIEVTVDGLPFDSKGITGISMTYGFNMIPVCMLTLNVPYVMENAPNFFADPSQYKVSTKNALNVTVSIKSVTGCLNFEGFFDGLSIVQTPGGMDYTAIIKNKFQLLTELYPKLIGMYPGSLLVSRFTPNLKLEHGSLLYDKILVASQSVLANLAPPDFYLSFLKTVVKSQKENEMWGTEIDISAIRTIIQDAAYAKSLDKCTELLEQVNTSYAQAPDFHCQKDLPYHAQLVANGGDDAWQLLINVMSDSGCVLLPSNKELYVVPQSNFIKLSGKCPSPQEQSTIANTAYPADYSNFVLNDNSYRNIKYCFVAAVGQGAAISSRQQAINMQWLGMYPKAGKGATPDDGATGIFLTHAPPWLGRNIGSIFMLHTRKVAGQQDNDYTKAGEQTKIDSSDASQEAIKKIEDEYKQKYGKDSEAVKSVLNDYAKARFLQEKYTDRTGSFGLQFNPKWVPGTTGFLASRQPKVMFNFYVTGVTHQISISGARTGTASTQINFNSARYAGDMSGIPSVDNNELYDYNEDAMVSLQNKWLQDNNADFNRRK